MSSHFETFVQKIYKTLAMFLVEIHLFLIVCFFSYILVEMQTFWKNFLFTCLLKAKN